MQDNSFDSFRVSLAHKPMIPCYIPLLSKAVEPKSCTRRGVGMSE
ncbi:hypothetical protein BH09VER1_BH09VER1_02520 [soil metagenome]